MSANVKGRIVYQLKRAKANVSASQSDFVLVPAVPGKSIVVLSLAMVCGGTETSATFGSKPAGASAAISCLFANGKNGGAVLPHNEQGWFETNAGEALTVTTGAGSATGILLNYAEM